MIKSFSSDFMILANTLPIARYIYRINEQILNPIIMVLFAVALIVFIWGLISFIQGASSPDARKTGQKHLLWGLVGMVIMLSVYGIISMLLSTFNIDEPDMLNHRHQNPPFVAEAAFYRQNLSDSGCGPVLDRF